MYKFKCQKGQLQLEGEYSAFEVELQALKLIEKSRKILSNKLQNLKFCRSLRVFAPKILIQLEFNIVYM